MMEGNLGLIATGKSNLDGVTPMYLWRLRDYTYEVYDGCVELLEETPYEVALKKFEKRVDKVVLV